MQYEVVVRGRLGGPLTRWFSELEVSWADPDITCLVGGFADQAELHEVLTRLGDLGIELASVRRLDDASTS